MLLNVTGKQYFFSRLDFREGFKIALNLPVALKGIIEDGSPLLFYFYITEFLVN